MTLHWTMFAITHVVSINKAKVDEIRSCLTKVAPFSGTLPVSTNAIDYTCRQLLITEITGELGTLRNRDKIRSYDLLMESSKCILSLFSQKDDQM